MSSSKPANLKGAATMDPHRVLPQAPDAESGLLSSILIDPIHTLDLCDESHLTKEHFAVPANGEVFQQLQDMRTSGEAIDFISLTQRLRDARKLDFCGGAAAITGLFTLLPTSANAPLYIKIIEEKFTLRALIRSGTEIVGRAYDEQDNVQGLLDEAERQICSISRHDTAKTESRTTKSLVVDFMHRLQHTLERNGEIAGISTGFPDVDKILDGLKGGEMTVIAARPSAGKTALAMNIAEHIAVTDRIPTAVFSLEMSNEQLINRMVLGMARVNWQMVRNNLLLERDYAAINDSAARLSDAPIHFIDKSGVSPSYIGAVLRRWKKRHGIKVAFIDYLQLVKGSKNYKGDNRQAEVAEISGGLKAIAKELDIAMVVLAQLNRSPDSRTGPGRGVPRVSDLRESGAIEQDADVIGLLHRDEMYAETDDEREEAQGKATLNIAKQRNGPTGPVRLTFLKEITRFETRAVDPN